MSTAVETLAESSRTVGVEQTRTRKIVHVVLSLAPGGLERLVCDLSQETIASGMEVVICCLDTRGALASSVEQHGIRVELVKRSGGLDLGLIPKLIRFFRRERPAVVHTHGPDPMFYGAWAALFAGVPTRLHTLHDTMLADAPWRHRLKFKLAARALHFLVAVSKAAEHIAAGELTTTRLLTIQNGIDQKRFSPSAAPRHSSSCIIGTVARLSPEKGIDRLIDAFAALATRHPAIQLLIAGDGPARPALVEQVNRLGLTDRVTFTGHCDRVKSVLDRLDVFVLPSLTEGIPLALLEAMAAGVPVIATAVGGVPEVVEDGVSGVLVPADDVTALAGAIDQIVADPSRRRDLAQNGRTRVVDRFSLSAMAAAYRELYRRDTSDRLWVKPLRALFRRVLPTSVVLWRGSLVRSEAAITFDDGPDPTYTPQLLEILARYGARGTFFLIGNGVTQYPELVSQIVEAGHEIASHSHTHPDFKTLTWRAAIGEIDSARRALARWTQPTAPRLFRPPFGRVCLTSIIVPWLRGETVVLWNIDYKDYRAEELTDITAKVARHAIAGGDIIVYHGHSEVAVAALPAILESGRRAGVTFVPVSRMLLS
jgi:sugar transferase (PEP-CTERM/EpsH1 system associated)